MYRCLLQHHQRSISAKVRNCLYRREKIIRQNVLRVRKKQLNKAKGIFKGLWNSWYLKWVLKYRSNFDREDKGKKDIPCFEKSRSNDMEGNVCLGKCKCCDIMRTWIVFRGQVGWTASEKGSKFILFWKQFVLASVRIKTRVSDLKKMVSFLPFFVLQRRKLSPKSSFQLCAFS